MASEHDNDDIFDCIVMAEESFRGQGYRDGFETGTSRGLLTGRRHGASHGARLSTEMAFYHGFAVTWKSLLERRTEAKGRKRQVKALDALLGSIPASGMEEPQSEKLQEEMEKLRSKFRQACSVLGVQTDFNKSDWRRHSRAPSRRRRPTSSGRAPAAADVIRARPNGRGMASFERVPLADAELDFPGSPYSVSVLKVGYYRPQPDGGGAFRADGTVTLVAGAGNNILVDTGGPWGRDSLLESLRRRGLEPGDVHVVVGTHGHSDHVGNLNLFPSAVIIVGHDVSRSDVYLPNRLGRGEAYVVDEHVRVVPTPGHSGQDLSVQVTGTSAGTILVAGDLFDSLDDDEAWRASSLQPALQELHRRKALETADVIVPGHGPPFRVLCRVGPELGGSGKDVKAAVRPCQDPVSPKMS